MIRDVWSLGALILVTFLSGPLAAADLADARRLYREGKYDECAQLAVETIAEGYHGEDWPLLKINSDMERGRYVEARQTVEAAIKNFRYSVRLRYLACRVYRHNNQPDRVKALTEEISELATRSTYRYGDSANRVTLGRFYADRGADPRRVLETFYDPVKSSQPQFADAFIASGELALSKSDFALAAEEFQNALKRSPDDPDIHYGLARAYSPSDNELANEHIEAALKINPHHAPTLLLLVDNRIDAENYEEADQVIQQVLDINPLHPEAWAYRAVLAHLRSDEQAEKAAREKALSSWKENPLVDHLIGRKLSQKYRFEEGAAYQRKAIAFDKLYMPAQIQLAQDLLRLGQVDEGWQRAELVFDADAYNVVAHNLVRLQSNMRKFHSLENEDFIVRMDAKEAAIYGQRVLQLLGRAKEQLCAKYDVTINEPVTVEIFPQQQDFAIRTFGLPGGAGFLGVCFGRVITANSPASQGDSPSNLDSVLWHEFCHVVTLQKTRNRMPRWLSEGISVYEERQANRAWGQAMDLIYCRMIEEGALTPVSKLSGAFLRPESPLHLQFAYYESSLVVEYLIEQYGRDVVNRVLDDLGIGMPINESLGRYTGSIDALDSEFEQFARERATAYAPKATWESIDAGDVTSPEALAGWLEEHPNNLAGLQQYAEFLLADEQYEEAQEVIERLIQLCPDEAGPGSGYALQAKLCRATGDVQRETTVLEHLAERNSDATDVFLRLMELAKDREDWKAVAKNAERMLAVNPLIPTPHRFRAEAAEKLHDWPAAASSYRALLEMDPADPALVHFRLAYHLQELQQTDEALRHDLMALEEAPRYREAHRLLLKIIAPQAASEPDDEAPQTEPEDKLNRNLRPAHAEDAADRPAAQDRQEEAGQNKQEKQEEQK